MDYVKHRAISYRNRNHIKNTVTLKSLTKIARQNGYIVYKYSATKTIMILLGVYDDSLLASSVSAKDTNGNVIIFIDDSVSENKQLFALAHEIGHIVLEHTPVCDPSLKRKQENDANKFAHYILSKRPFPFDAVSLSLVVASTMLIGLILTFSLQPTDSNTVTTSVNSDAVSQPSVSSAVGSTTNASNETICYYTKHGSVYHIYRDCTYLNAADEVYEATVGNCPPPELCSRCKKRFESYK